MKCFICKKQPAVKKVLMNGSSGFRRYDLCQKCADEQAAKQKAKAKP